ncbi:MAG TPA: glycosyltransferase family 9 protein [Gemmatimonadaceae bacterium]|nr:glycosyltransferase family 9 protein [Gemmatimonadaceae bacterium]
MSAPPRGLPVARADSGMAASLRIGPIPSESPDRILLIQLRRLGDVILATGILEDLRRAFPRARLDFLTSPLSAQLLRHHPLIDELLVYDRSRPLAEARRIRARRYDWVIDGQGSPTTARLTRLSGARVRAGWGVRVWHRLYTHVLPRSGLPVVYVVRERQRFLEMLGVPIGEPRTRLVVSPDELRSAEEALRGAGVPDGVPRVALVLSVSEPIREWPAERFAELAHALRAEGVAPVLLENPDDAEKLRRFRRRAPDIPVVRAFDLRLLLGALARCHVLVSGDTGPAHMATALGVPRVTLYGPTEPVQWNPQLPTTTILVDEAVAVMRARDRRKHTDHPGLVGIPVAAVKDAVRHQLAERGERGHSVSTFPLPVSP